MFTELSFNALVEQNEEFCKTFKKYFNLISKREIIYLKSQASVTKPLSKNVSTLVSPVTFSAIVISLSKKKEFT